MISFIRVVIVLIALSIIGINVLLHLFTSTETEYVLMEEYISLEPNATKIYTCRYVNGKLKTEYLGNFTSPQIQIQLENVDLAPNDVVAPHLYDWWFDGSGDAVVFPVTLSGNSMDWIVWGWLVDDDTSHYHKIGGFGRTSPKIDHVLWIEEYRYSSGNEVFLVVCNASDGSYITRFKIQLNSQYYGVYGEHRVHLDSSTFAYYFNGELQGSHDISAYTTSDYYMPYRAGDTSFALGARSVKGGLNSADPVKSRIGASAIYIDNKLVSLVSATFTNGTHYFDIITGHAFTTYGNPIRIPAEQTWLWLIKGLESDNKVHFKYFPENTLIRLRDPATGGIICEFNITDSPNAAGLIEDYSVLLNEGNYTVEAIVPFDYAVRIENLPPYAHVYVNGTLYKADEHGILCIPSAYNETVTLHLKIIAKKYTEKEVDIPFSYSNGVLCFNLGTNGLLVCFAYNGTHFTPMVNVPVNDVVNLGGEGNVIYPVFLKYDYGTGEVEVWKSKYLLILPKAMFKLPAKNTYITIDTSQPIVCERLEAKESELIIDNIKISADNCNLTIKEFYRNKLKFVAEGESGEISYTMIRNIERPEQIVIKHPDGTVKVFKQYLSDLNFFYQVSGDTIYYDPNNKLLIVKILHHSPAEIVIEGQVLSLYWYWIDIFNTIFQILYYAIPLFVFLIVLKYMLSQFRKVI